MELTDQRLTEATFLSVRTQTNAKAKAVWHAALDDIWEAGGGGGGGGGWGGFSDPPGSDDCAADCA